MELRREADKLESLTCLNVDAVLRLYDVEPGEMADQGSAAGISVALLTGEITQRIYDALRQHGTGVIG